MTKSNPRFSAESNRSPDTESIRDMLLGFPDDAFSDETYFSPSVGTVFVSVATHGFEGTAPLVESRYKIATESFPNEAKKSSAAMSPAERGVSRKRLSSLSKKTDEKTGRTVAHDLACEGKLGEKEMCPEVLSLSQYDGRSVAHILAQHGFLMEEHLVVPGVSTLVWRWTSPLSGETCVLSVEDVLLRRSVFLEKKKNGETKRQDEEIPS